MSASEVYPPGPPGTAPSPSDRYFAGLAYSRAKNSFLLGALSVVCFVPLLGLLAIYVGVRALSDISASAGKLRGQSWAWQGIFLGAINTLGWIIFAVHAAS